MIALEVSEKSSKSPKKPKVDVRFEDEKSGSEETDADSGRGIESSVESADEGDLEDESGGEEEDSGSAGEEGSGSDDLDGNPGWADAIRKILGTKKPKRKKTIVLSKAKRLCDIKPKEQVESLQSFEVEGGAEGVVKEESNASKESRIKEDKEAEHGRRKRREADLGIRVKPSPLERERERTLQKIATKGVVQLFNAVRQQQKDIEEKLEEAGPLERKREKVLKNIDKRAFLDVLMGGTKSVSVDGPVKTEKREKNSTEKKGGEEDTWNVLRDDFMMGAKLKDWDKTEEDEADSSAPEDMDSDD